MTVYVTHTSGYLCWPPTWVGIKEEACRHLNDSLMLRSSWLNKSFLADTKNSPHHNLWKMEAHKNVIFKIASIRIDKLKQASHGFYSPYFFNQRKTLQFGISIFRHIFVELHSCVPFTLVAEVVVDSLPSDLSHPLATLIPKSPRYMAEVQCVECPAGCVIAESPPSCQAVEGWKPNLLFGDYWGWNTTQLIQYRRGYNEPLSRMPSLTNQC